MKTKLLLTLVLLAGSASLAHTAVYVGARFGYGGYYGGCYRCGYYPRGRVVVGYGYGWRRPWYRGYYWRAGYWGRPAYVGAYWAPPAPVAYVPPPPAPAPVAPAPAPTCAPAPPPPACPPAPAPKTCVRTHHHHTVAHRKVTHPCTPTSS